MDRVEPRALRARQPGADTQGALPPQKRRGCGRARVLDQTRGNQVSGHENPLPLLPASGFFLAPPDSPKGGRAFEGDRTSGTRHGAADQLRDHPAAAGWRRAESHGADRGSGRVPAAVHRHHQPRRGGLLRRNGGRDSAPGEAQAAGDDGGLRAGAEQVRHRRRAARSLPGVHARGDRGLPHRAALSRDRQRARRARRRQRLSEATARGAQRQPFRGRSGRPDRQHEPRPLPGGRSARRRALELSASASVAIRKSTSRRRISPPTCASSRPRSRRGRATW